MKIFLSYCNADQNIGETVANKLNEADHEVYSAFSVQFGQDIVNAISDMMKTADAFILIVSNDSRVSNLQTWEWRTVLESLWEKPEIPFLGVIVGDAEVPAFLLGRYVIQVANRATVDNYMEEIINSLTKSSFACNSDGFQKDFLNNRLKEVSHEVSKFELSRTELEEQSQWLLDKIKKIESIRPNSIEVVRYYIKFINILKALDNESEIEHVLEKCIKILENNNGDSSSGWARLHNKIATILSSSEYKGILDSVCHSIQVVSAGSLVTKISGDYKYEFGGYLSTEVSSELKSTPVLLPLLKKQRDIKKSGGDS